MTTTGIQRVRRDASIYEESVLMDIISEATSARRLFPHTTIAMKDLKGKYWKKVADHRAKVGARGDPSQVPDSMNATQLAEADLPYISTRLKFKRLELERINTAEEPLPIDERIRMVAHSFSEWEDDVFYIGTDDNNDSTPQGAMTATGTNSTATAAAFDATTSAKVIESTSQILDELEFGTGVTGNGIKDLAKYPIIMMMTSDVWYWMLGLESAVTGQSIIDKVDAILKRVGGGGSGIVRNNWLGGSVVYDGSKKRTFTAGTSNLAVMAIDKNHFEILASPLNQIPKIDAHEGLDILFEERYAPIFKTIESIVYDASVDIVP